MAQYYTDFSEYADTAALQADWTVRWHAMTTSLVSNAGYTGGKALQESGPQDRRLLSWNAIDGDAARADVEVLARVQTSSTLSVVGGPALRGAGNSSTEIGYVCWIDLQEITIDRYIGSPVALGVVGPAVINDWNWIRFRINGTNIKGKTWTGAVGAEPPSWGTEVTNSEILDAGWVGLIFFRVGSHLVDVFSVGTDGDPAPTGPVGGTRRRSPLLLTPW